MSAPSRVPSAVVRVAAGFRLLLLIALGLGARPPLASGEDRPELTLVRFAVVHSADTRFLAPPKELLEKGTWAKFTAAELDKVSLRVAPDLGDKVSIVVRLAKGGIPVELAPVAFTVDKETVQPPKGDFPRNREKLWPEVKKACGIKTDEAAKEYVKRRLGEDPEFRQAWRLFGETDSVRLKLTPKTKKDGTATDFYSPATVTLGKSVGKETIVVTAAGADPLKLHIEVGADLVKCNEDTNGKEYWKVLRFKKGANPYATPEVRDHLDRLDDFLAASKWLDPDADGTADRPRIAINDISSQFGGILLPHIEHLTGACVDMKPVSTVAGETKPVDTGYRCTKVTDTCPNGAEPCAKPSQSVVNYDRENTRLLIDVLTAGGTRGPILFLDPCLAHPGVRQAVGHYHHLHVSWEPVRWLVTRSSEEPFPEDWLNE